MVIANNYTYGKWGSNRRSQIWRHLGIPVALTSYISINLDIKYSKLIFFLSLWWNFNLGKLVIHTLLKECGLTTDASIQLYRKNNLYPTAQIKDTFVSRSAWSCLICPQPFHNLSHQHFKLQVTFSRSYATQHSDRTGMCQLKPNWYTGQLKLIKNKSASAFIMAAK